VYARCDWILIRKYVSAEPSSTFGSEQARGGSGGSGAVSIARQSTSLSQITTLEITVVSPANEILLLADTTRKHNRLHSK
jgi:hypothetical protein